MAPVVKNPPDISRDIRDAGSIPASGRFLGGPANPLQYSCLKNLMDRGAWWAAVHVVTRNRTWLSVWVHTRTYTKQIMNEKLLHGSGSSTQCSGKSRKSAVWLQTANSLRCIVQTNTTLSSNYSPIRGFPGNSDGKESARSAGDLGLIPG